MAEEASGERELLEPVPLRPAARPFHHCSTDLDFRVLASWSTLFFAAFVTTGTRFGTTLECCVWP